MYLYKDLFKVQYTQHTGPSSRPLVLSPKIPSSTIGRVAGDRWINNPDGLRLEAGELREAWLWRMLHNLVDNFEKKEFF